MTRRIDSPEDDSSQKSQDSGGISPAVAPATSKTEGGTTANEGMSAKRTVSDVGKVKQRASHLDGDPSCMASGASSIDPGGSRYSSRKSSTDQD